MKYIFFTFDGFAFPIAHKLIQEGHEVLIGQVLKEEDTLPFDEALKATSENPFWKKRRIRLYQNILERIPAHVLIQKMKKIKKPQDYFVFFDHNRLFRYAEQVKELGFHGNFPTENDYLFETDRNAAKDFVKEYYPHLKTSYKKDFLTIKDAKLFLRDTSFAWVIKGHDKEAPTFVPHSNNPVIATQQIIDIMKNFQIFYEKSGFILERKISSLIEITPEKIYYNGVPIALTVNFENKPIGSGNLGFQTMCTGDLIFPIDMNSRINSIAFPPIIDDLAKQHKGLFFWDASLLIDKDTGEIFFGEFCPNRPGYNSVYNELSQSSTVNNFFESIINNKSPFEIGTVGASVTLFNLARDSDEQIMSNISINLSQNSMNHIWPFDLYSESKENNFLLSGWDIYVAPVTGKGRTITQAVDNVYNYLDECSFPDMYYRPQFDFLSLDYPTSILNRVRYGVKHQLYSLPFLEK